MNSGRLDRRLHAGKPGGVSLWDVGTDIGGTFTDIVATEATGRTLTAKVASRPDAPVAAMLAAIAAIGLDRTQLRRFVHATTRVTNAIVQDRLPAVALITTAGFEDVLEVARYRRRDLYRLDIVPKAPPLVGHAACFGVDERIDHMGRVVHALDDREIDRLVLWLRASGVASVAVCLLHAYANPAHEQRIGASIKDAVAHVSLSHEVNREAREYERASSTVFNAAAMPIAGDYLAELERALPLGAGLQVFHSAGGIVPVAVARRLPIVMAKSGPAAGVAAAVRVGRDIGRTRLLTLDMGGTTTDVCLVVDGVADMVDGRMEGDRPLRQPMLAVQSIGAGGGSIVRLGSGGLSVGPHSAGAEPGPACYGQGGTEATVTDANLVLGYLDPRARLADRPALDADLAARAIAPIAAGLGLGLIDTALGIVRVADAAMVRALLRVTVERGIDGRDCTLLAFGGGGPMHAAGLADGYGLAEIVVPAASSAFSAFGCLVADPSLAQQRTVRLALHGLDRVAFADQLQGLERRAAAALGDAVVGMVLEHTAMMRYAAQSDALAVAFAAPLDPAALDRAFRAQHRAVYGYATDEPCVIEAVRLVARLPSDTRAGRPDPGPPTPPATRLCAFAGVGRVPTRILDRDSLDDPVDGPAIVADRWSTVVVPPGWRASPLPAGHLMLTRT